MLVEILEQKIPIKTLMSMYVGTYRYTRYVYIK